MTIRATVRVRPREQAEPASRPHPEDLREAARLLQERGFRVLRIGRFGVSVEATPELFRRELGLAPFAAPDWVQAPRPVVADLDGLIDLVEATPEPESF